MPESDGPSIDSRVVGLLEEMTRLVRFLALREARQIAQTELDTEEKQRVFSLTNGARSVRDISEITKVNKNTVSKWWREWHAVGLVESATGTNRTRRVVFSLSDLGL